MLCRDTSEATELHRGHRLFLLPVARMNITVQLPSVHHSGKSISNLEVMDRIRAAIKPDSFLHLKVIKSNVEFIRFEGELETRALLPKIKARLDNKVLKLPGFTEILRVRACQAKLTQPTRHDWDAFFRDAVDMDEMKPGERPDTMYLKGLPIRWFMDDTGGGPPPGSLRPWPVPSERVVRDVFSVLGELRAVSLPDYEGLIGRFDREGGSAPTDGTFEAFVQYMEYVCFVRAMDAFRGMKLMRQDPDGAAYTADIQVDFDRNKHLSEKSIRRRFLLQQKLREEELARECARKAELERRRKEADQAELRMKEKAKEERRKVREERRRKKSEKQRQKEEEKRMQEKIALEERKILIAVRKLETIRLLSELLRRVKVHKERELGHMRSSERSRSRSRRVEKELCLPTASEDPARKRRERKARKKSSHSHSPARKNCRLALEAS